MCTALYLTLSDAFHQKSVGVKASFGTQDLYRDNAFFKVHGLTFLHRKDEHKHLSETLLDGASLFRFGINSRTFSFS